MTVKNALINMIFCISVALEYMLLFYNGLYAKFYEHSTHDELRLMLLYENCSLH